MATRALAEVRALLFDVFGTVVDWRSGVTRSLRSFGGSHGLNADWAGLADAWRGHYQPAMEEVRSGRRPFAILDVLHRESLVAVLAAAGIAGVSDRVLDELTLAWHHLDPWPDVLPGLNRLRTRYRIGTLSNGNTRLLTDMASRAGLHWDAVLCAETVEAYKPTPAAYLRNVARLGLDPAEVMLVAAHNGDLAAARSLGLRTAFVARPTEHGPGQMTDLRAQGDWDVIATDFDDLADQLLGCDRSP